MIDKESVAFVRSSERTSAILNFKTTTPINCDLEFWTETTKTSPSKMDCGQKDKTEITHKVEPLDPDLFYTVKVYLWQGSVREDVKYFQVKEQGDDSTFKTNNLSITRMIVPQYSTEHYQHDLDQPHTIVEIRSKLSPQVGCKKGTNNLENPFIRAKAPNNINALSSNGFASGSATPNPYDKNRLSQFFEFLQTNLNWDWAFILAGKDYQFTSRPPAYLTEFNVNTGGKRTRLSKEARRLFGEVTKINLDSTDLILDWKTINSTSTSHISAEIRNDDGSAGIHCVFSNRDGTGTIKQELLAELPSGSYHLTSTFESNQIFVRKASDFPTWLISSQDWRYANLIKP